MSTITKSPSTLGTPTSPQQPRNELWRGDLPPPPTNLTYSPPNQDRYSNSLNIINRHGNLLSLIDAVYPSTICHVCDTELPSPSETDQHYQTKHFHHHNNTNNNKKSKPKQRYLCLSPHCDQTFRSRGLLRFHISTCHLVDNVQVPKTDPLYLLYAPPSLLTSPSDLGMQMSASLSPSNSTNTTTTTLSGGAPMLVPQKRKYERRQKTWNPVGKSSLPGQTNFTLSTTTTTSLNTDQPQPKRRGRPPKIKSVMPLSNMINNNNSSSSNRNEHIKSNRSSPSMITFNSDDTGKTSEPSSNDLPSTSASSTKTLQQQQPKVFRLVQQVIPHRTSSSSSPSSSTTTTTFSSFRPKNLSRSNLSQTSQRLLAEKYNPLQCPSCHTIFQRKKNVATHLATDHPGEECFQCIYPDCYHPKRFSTREGLVYHLLHTHDTGELNKNTGSDTSASELALMDSSDTASMDDDTITTTTMIQPLKKTLDDEDNNNTNDNSRPVNKNIMEMTTDKKNHSAPTTTRKSNGTTPTKTPSQRGRKKRS